MMRAAILVLAALSLAACHSQAGKEPSADQGHKGPPPPPAPITLSSRPDAGPGEKLFIVKCIMCHGPGGMGTALLSRRVKPALLEQRTNLTVDFVIQAARQGIGNMPAIPRGEVSDAELRQIADYLASDKGKTK